MVKDKNAPKAAMTSYACFVQVIREEHKKKHPDELVVFAEFSKKCSEKWRQMTPIEKKRFEDIAHRDKDRYEREMCAYAGPGRRRRRPNKDPNQPKRNLSAFFFFCEEQRPHVRQNHPEWRVGDIAKELGKRWGCCPSKDLYERMADGDKERYQREMAEFKAGTFTGTTKRARLDGPDQGSADLGFLEPGASELHLGDIGCVEEGDDEDEPDEDHEAEAELTPAVPYPGPALVASDHLVLQTSSPPVNYGLAAAQPAQPCVDMALAAVLEGAPQ